MANTGRLPATSAVSSIVPDCATLPRSLRQNTNYQQLPTAGEIPTNNAQIPGGIPISGQFPTSTPAYQAPANTPFMIQTPTAGNGAPTNAVHDVVENDAFSMLPPKAVVLYDFQPQSQQEVAVLLGDIVDCLAVDSDRKWLYVRTLRNTVGYIPSAYCRFMAVATPQPARRANQNQARANLQANRNRSTSSATQFQATTLDRRTTKRTPVLSARFVTSLNDDVICQVNQPAVNRSIPSNYVDSNRLIERNAESRQTDTQNLADNTQNLVLNTQAVSKTQTVPNTQRNTDRADNTLSPCSVMSTSSHRVFVRATPVTPQMTVFSRNSWLVHSTARLWNNMAARAAHRLAVRRASAVLRCWRSKRYLTDGRKSRSSNAAYTHLAETQTNHRNHRGFVDKPHYRIIAAYKIITYV